MAKKCCYAVRANGKYAVFDNYEDARAAYEGVSGAEWKGFAGKEQAYAWLADKRGVTPAETVASGDAVYADSGTSLQGGRPTECRVTDKNGVSLLGVVLPPSKINERGNFLPGDVSNNYGELKAVELAIRVALRTDAKQVWTDSQLVYKWWSMGHVKNNVAEKTRQLALEVSKLRKQFERDGGSVLWLSGDDNPADLGYHKS